MQTKFSINMLSIVLVKQKKSFSKTIWYICKYIGVKWQQQYIETNLVSFDASDELECINIKFVYDLWWNYHLHISNAPNNDRFALVFAK